MNWKKIRNPFRKREQIVGYCLACVRGPVRKVGEQWCPYDTSVWVLPTMRAARKIEANTEAWDQICKVEGLVHITKRAENGRIWTDEPTRLTIAEIHPQFIPPIPQWAINRQIIRNTKRLLKSGVFR